MARLMIGSLRLSMALMLGAGSIVCWGGDEAGLNEPESASSTGGATQERMPGAEQSSSGESRAQPQDNAPKPDDEAALADAVRAGIVLKGMTKEQVTQARGAPNRKEVIPPDAELWHYHAGEVAFSDGKVSYVSLASKREAESERPRQSSASEETESNEPLSKSSAEQVAIPQIRVGDNYVYESVDPEHPDASISTRRTVTSTNGKVVLTSIMLNSKRAKPRNLHFDHEWNLVATRGVQNTGRDYSPPLKYYDFPLYPGKTWHQTTTETDIKTGAIRTHTVSGKVEQWETVSVPAGRFRGIKVILDTSLFDPSSGERINGSDISWYVPEVRRSVKSVTTGKGGSQRIIRLMSYDVR